MNLTWEYLSFLHAQNPIAYQFYVVKLNYWFFLLLNAIFWLMLCFISGALRLLWDFLSEICEIF